MLLPAGLAAAASPLAGKSGLHGLSVFGDLKYPSDFKAFDYVNPAAPKGGTLVLTAPFWYYNQAPNTFNTLNGYTFKGDAPPRVELTFDTLMVRALDEADAVYGLVAETVSLAPDGNEAVFELRSAARFNDGTPLTAADIVFSLETLKAHGHPDITESLREMTGARAEGDHRLRVSFSGKQKRDAVLTLAATMPIFSRAFYAGRDFEAATMQPPLGSGPYRIGTVDAGRSITYERVPDYWAKDLPVNRGRYHFDRIRVEFYADENAEFEAFAKGDITYREEFSSKNWATRYDFPAARDGRVKRPDFPAEQRPEMYGWFFNLRRPVFADPRVRQAIGMVFDFSWTNKNLFFSLYSRSTSFFETSDFAAKGPPDDAERALLAPFADRLPAGILDAPAYVPPDSDGSGHDRALLRAAQQLLLAAGWRLEGTRLVDASGAPLSVEFLINVAAFERVLGPFIANLKAIGVDASIRTVDPTQYQRRKDSFDFDILASRISFDATPIDGIAQQFGSASATLQGGSNIAGLNHPVVDALIARLGTVESRAELVSVLRALDRVLRALQIWIPAWHSDSHRVALWDIFGWPATKPAYGFSPETTWWFDEAKATAIGKAG